MKYPKQIEAQTFAKQSKEQWRAAAKLYLSSESFNEFKVKLAAEGLDHNGIGFMFAVHYMLHNTADGNVHRIGLKAFLIALSATAALAALLSLVFVLLSVSLAHIWLSLIAFPITYLVAGSTMEICNNVIESELSDAR